MIALVVDIDGVILRDNQPIPGAAEFAARLVTGTMPFVFLTNFPSQTPADLRNRFLEAGIDVPVERFYTSAMATAEFLRDQPPGERKAFVIGEGALVHALYDAGFILSEADADFVVLGETQSYHIDMIQKAAQLIREGARFIATNPDVAGPLGRPSCGALAALSASAAVVAGLGAKPQVPGPAADDRDVAPRPPSHRRADRGAANTPRKVWMR